jgi:hypothetical protein
METKGAFLALEQQMTSLNYSGLILNLTVRGSARRLEVLEGKKDEN